MNYGELKTQFEGLLKRRDLTDTQRDTWLQMSITRIQRVLRIPSMEKSATVLTDSASQDGIIPIPNDLLELKAVTIDAEETDLQSRSLREVLQGRVNVGTPTMYARRGSDYVVSPYPTDDLTIRIDYWGEFDALSDDTDENALSISAWDVIVYGALVLACDWFLDKRASVFKEHYTLMMMELQSQADRDELTNAHVSPAHVYSED